MIRINNSSITLLLYQSIKETVIAALAEDVGSGDITAELIPVEKKSSATIISREQAILCGIAWAEEVFHQVDPKISVIWCAQDGDLVAKDQIIGRLNGCARSLLTAERCALNFLQTLSGTATLTHHYVDKLRNTKVQLLDTRKTVPGLRLAQKYAVTCGGGNNHRMGLYDAFLIKENHIMACGSIVEAIKNARKNHAGKRIEVEVETLGELEEALVTDVDVIMLDNFTLEMIDEAVALNRGTAKLEVSGNVTLDTIDVIARTGVDYISVGALTKDVKAVDLSMRFEN